MHWQGEEAEVNKRQTALLQQTADAAQLYFEERQETAAAAELRRTEEVDRMAAETEALRQQLSSAVSTILYNFEIVFACFRTFSICF